MVQKNLLKILTARYHFDSEKSFLKQYSYRCYVVIPARFYVFKVNNRNFRGRCEICSNSTLRIPQRRLCSGVVIVNFRHISHLALVFLLPTFNKQLLVEIPDPHLCLSNMPCVVCYNNL